MLLPFQFLSSLYKCSIHTATNIHEVLGTLTPLSSPCKGASFYLVSIHSPSQAFQGVLSLPSQGLNSCSVSGFHASLCDGLTYRALTKQSERCTLISFFAVLLSVDDELPSPILKPSAVSKNESFQLHGVLHSGCKTEQNRASVLSNTVSYSLEKLFNTSNVSDLKDS